LGKVLLNYLDKRIDQIELMIGKEKYIINIQENINNLIVLL